MTSERPAPAPQRPRWTRHKAQAAGLMLAAIPIAVAFAVYIQRRWDLYTTSRTMTLFEVLVGFNALIILALWDRRWYPAAWLAATLLPLALGSGYVRLVESDPPTPPMG